MELVLRRCQKPRTGDLFRAYSSGALYTCVECKENDPTLTPRLIVNLKTGIVVGRSTSWELALRDAGIEEIEVLGRIVGYDI